MKRHWQRATLRGLVGIGMILLVYQNHLYAHQALIVTQHAAGFLGAAYLVCFVFSGQQIARAFVSGVYCFEWLSLSHACPYPMTSDIRPRRRLLP